MNYPEYKYQKNNFNSIENDQKSFKIFFLDSGNIYVFLLNKGSVSHDFSCVSYAFSCVNFDKITIHNYGEIEFSVMKINLGIS